MAKKGLTPASLALLDWLAPAPLRNRPKEWDRHEEVAARLVEVEEQAAAKAEAAVDLAYEAGLHDSEASTEAPYCPCAGQCHHDTSPCSFGCLNAEQRHQAAQLQAADAQLIRLHALPDLMAQLLHHVTETDSWKSGYRAAISDVRHTLNSTAEDNKEAVGACYFCKSTFPIDALIAGYDTWDEQRLACLACNERMQPKPEAVARIREEAVQLIGEMARFMRAHLTYAGPNGTDRCVQCHEHLGGDYDGPHPHKPDCYAAKLLDRAALLTENKPKSEAE